MPPDFPVAFLLPFFSLAESECIHVFFSQLLNKSIYISWQNHGLYSSSTSPFIYGNGLIISCIYSLNTMKRASYYSCLCVKNN